MSSLTSTSNYYLHMIRLFCTYKKLNISNSSLASSSVWLESVVILCQPLQCICLVFKNDVDKPRLWCPLNFIVCHFPFDDAIVGAQAEKYKHTYIYVYEMYIRALHSVWKESDFSGDGENSSAPRHQFHLKTTRPNIFGLFSTYTYMNKLFSSFPIYHGICLAVCNDDSRLNFYRSKWDRMNMPAYTVYLKFYMYLWKQRRRQQTHKRTTQNTTFQLEGKSVRNFCCC